MSYLVNQLFVFCVLAILLFFYAGKKAHTSIKIPDELNIDPKDRVLSLVSTFVLTSLIGFVYIYRIVSTYLQSKEKTTPVEQTKPDEESKGHD